MQVQVARIGKPHGIRGEVTVEVFTDEPDERFAVGSAFLVEPAALGPLTIRSARWNKDILLLGFDEVADRNGAETLRGAKLFIDAESVEDEDDDAWYEHELIGLRVRIASDQGGYDDVGTVSGLRTMPAQDLLVVDSVSSGEVLVPFVAEIVPEVNVAEGFVLLTPPGGLFELNTEDAGTGEDDRPGESPSVREDDSPGEGRSAGESPSAGEDDSSDVEDDSSDVERR